MNGHMLKRSMGGERRTGMDDMLTKVCSKCASDEKKEEMLKELFSEAK